MQRNYDCFISHASEDKEGFVEPLAMELRRLGVRVWFDRFAIKVGDSLSRSIDEGLLGSRYGVLVISKAFLRKPWPEYELRGLVAREIGKEKIILPIWHGVNHDEVLNFSPTLADKMAIMSSGEDLNPIARQLIEVIRPDLFEHIHRLEALQSKFRSLPVREVPLNQLRTDTDIRHRHLTPQQMVRIRNVHYILQDVYDTGLAGAVLAFKRDLRINEEIFIWEGIAAAFSSYRVVICPQMEELREVLAALLMMSMGQIQDVLGSGQFEHLDRSRREILLKIWSQVPTEVEFRKED